MPVVIALGRSCKFHRSVKANENALRMYCRTMLNLFAAHVTISRKNFLLVLTYVANTIFVSSCNCNINLLKNILIT